MHLSREQYVHSSEVGSWASRPRSRVTIDLATRQATFIPSGGTERKAPNIQHVLALNLRRQVSHTLTGVSRSTSKAEMLHTCGIRGDRGGVGGHQLVG